MTASKANKLGSIFKAAVRKARKKASSSVPAGDKTLKEFVSSIDVSSSKSSSSSKSGSESSPKPTEEPALDDRNSLKKLSRDISSLLCVGDLQSSQESEEMTGYGSYLGTQLVIPWLANLSNNNVSLKRREVSRVRKQKFQYKNSQTSRFNQLIKMCGHKLGMDTAIEVFGKLGRESGVKEYNALIALCLEKARTTEDESVAFAQIEKACTLYNSMRQQGFPIEEGTYGPFLMYFIDMGMVEEFHFFCGPIKERNPGALPRLGFYEMLLWIGVNDDEKIRELCNSIAADDGKDDFNLKENYLLAICESGRKKDVMKLLEIIDITRISSVNRAANIFKSLGRLSLESFAEKFLLAFRTHDYGMENISELIFSYVSSIPNLAVEDIFLKFKSLHMKFKITPSSASYEKLIMYCCDLYKVHLALDILEEMCEVGLSLSIDTLHRILYATEDCYEFNLVRRIYSVICLHNLRPNGETFRSMISLSVKMKDFEGAYAMLTDLKTMNIPPNASIYNCILAGYFREKNVAAALMVLKQMKNQDVKPDAQTFSYLIGNCNREEDITKYYEELKRAGIQVTKHIYMALISAYATCGQFDKAKQVLSDKGIPVKGLNEIKSALVSALASSEQMSDALDIYNEIKQAGGSLEPKAVISLIEHLPSEGELSTLLQLLEELRDPGYWVDGCCRVVVHCARVKDLRCAVDLLKQLKENFHNDDLAMEALCDEVFAMIGEGAHKDVKFGLGLLQAIKGELGLTPSRKSLDFLLNACVNAKDLQNSVLIWREYHAAGLPYNVLTFLRMYQALLVSGDFKSARIMLPKIPTDDPHVRMIIEECQKTYFQSTSSSSKKKKKKGQKNRDEIPNAT